MEKLRTFYGKGQLVIGDKAAGVIEYYLEVWNDGGLDDGRGVLHGDPSLMVAAFTADATLRLDNGDQVAILVERLPGNQLSAEFRTTGPITIG